MPQLLQIRGASSTYQQQTTLEALSDTTIWDLFPFHKKLGTLDLLAFTFLFQISILLIFIYAISTLIPNKYESRVFKSEDVGVWVVVLFVFFRG